MVVCGHDVFVPFFLPSFLSFVVVFFFIFLGLGFFVFNSCKLFSAFFFSEMGGKNELV